MEEQLIYIQIFKREPELQENVFISQRVYETQLYLEKTLKGLPKDENAIKIFESMIEICQKELMEQFKVIGSYVLGMIVADMNKNKCCDENSINEKKKE